MYIIFYHRDGQDLHVGMYSRLFHPLRIEVSQVGVIFDQRMKRSCPCVSSYLMMPSGFLGKHCVFCQLKCNGGLLVANRHGVPIQY